MEQLNTDIDSGIRELDIEGYIRFSIKANDTEENQAVHDGFKEFCRIETDNNYTLGLRKLIENYERHNQIEALWETIGELRAKLEQFVESKDKDKKDTEGAF